MLSAPAGPYPALPADVVAYLEQFLEREPIGIPPAAYPDAVRQITAAGVAGGAVCDGLIGLSTIRQGPSS